MTSHWTTSEQFQLKPWDIQKSTTMNSCSLQRMHSSVLHLGVCPAHTVWQQTRWTECLTIFLCSGQGDSQQTLSWVVTKAMFIAKWTYLHFHQVWGVWSVWWVFEHVWAQALKIRILYMLTESENNQQLVSSCAKASRWWDSCCTINSQEKTSIHLLYRLSSLVLWGSWSPSGPTYTDKQPLILSFTPTGKLESPINLTLCVGGSWSACTEPSMHTMGGHSNSTQKGPKQPMASNLLQDPLAVRRQWKSTEPQCRPWKDIL